MSGDRTALKGEKSKHKDSLQYSNKPKTNMETISQKKKKTQNIEK